MGTKKDKKIKFVVSVKNAKEAEAVIENSKGLVEIIDVKNPDESTLGAAYPWDAEGVIKVVKNRAKVAISIGDLDSKAGFASLKAYSAAILGPDFITSSFFKIENKEQVVILEEKIKKAITLANKKTKIIAACYADYERANAIDFFSVASSVKHASIILLDTYIKDGKNIFDFISKKELLKLKNLCKKRKMKLILAGSLREKHLNKALKMDADYLGFRGILCENGEITERKVKKTFELIEKILISGK